MDVEFKSCEADAFSTADEGASLPARGGSAGQEAAVQEVAGLAPSAAVVVAAAAAAVAVVTPAAVVAAAAAVAVVAPAVVVAAAATAAG